MSTEVRTFEILDNPPCLLVLENGAVRIGHSRVPLERIVYHYNQGVSAEEFIEMFPSVKLGDAYGALHYYLNHREQVDAYAAWVEEEGDRIQAMIESQPGYKERQMAFEAKMDAFRRAQAESTIKL